MQLLFVVIIIVFLPCFRVALDCLALLSLLAPVASSSFCRSAAYCLVCVCPVTSVSPIYPVQHVAPKYPVRHVDVASAAIIAIISIAVIIVFSES